MPQRTVIAVVGSGSATERSVSNARELGRLIAEKGWILITGGRNAGVMRAANEGAKQIDGFSTIGILPDKNTEVSPGIDVAIFTGVGEARNNIIVLTADVIVACGVDDPGTASEVALAIKAEKPVVLLTPSDAARNFFISLGNEQIKVVQTPPAAIELAEGYLRSRA